MANDVVDSLDGILFRKYLKKLVGEAKPYAIFQGEKPLTDEDKIGQDFAVPTVLGTEQGITRKKSGAGNFTLASAVDSDVKQAIVSSAQHVMTSELTWQLAKSAAGEDRSAVKALGQIAMFNRDAIRRAIEIDFLHGHRPLGIVDSINTSGDDYIVVTDASWGAGIWAKQKNAELDFLTSNLATLDDTQTLISVDIINKRLYVADASNVNVGDYIFYAGTVEAGGTPVWHAAPGLIAQLLNTTEDLYGLDVSANDVLQGNAINASSEVASLGLFSDVLATLMSRGNDEEMIDVYISPLQYSLMNREEMAARVFDASYKPSLAETGVQAIRFHTPAGQVRLTAHPLMKDSEAIGFSWKHIHRPGETDVTYMSSGGPSDLNKQGQYFSLIPGKAGYQLISYHASALYHEYPSYGFVITGMATEIS